MEIKKSQAADLENKKSSFFLIGLTLATALIYVGLEWTKTEVTKYDDVVDLFDEQVEEEVQATIQDQTPPPPPPETVAPPPVLTEINIVDNAQEVGDVTITSSDVDENTAVVVAPPVQIVEDTEEEIDEVFVFTKVEKKPEYPGGQVALMQWLAKNTKYPIKAQELGIEGTVIVGFTIGKDGKATDVKILRGKDDLLDKEALRVINAMPAWSPGMNGGKPVRVSYQLPVKFRLQ